MQKQRVYADTSVFGGCLDREFSAESKRLVGAVQGGQLTVLVSEVVLRELETAPEGVRRILLDLPPASVERVELSDEVYELRDAYPIVSWNSRHIVRLDKIKAFNRVNFELGYGLLTILSPKEVATDDCCSE